MSTLPNDPFESQPQPVGGEPDTEYRHINVKPGYSLALQQLMEISLDAVFAPSGTGTSVTLATDAKHFDSRASHSIRVRVSDSGKLPEFKEAMMRYALRPAQSGDELIVPIPQTSQFLRYLGQFSLQTIQNSGRPYRESYLERWENALQRMGFNNKQAWAEKYLVVLEQLRGERDFYLSHPDTHAEPPTLLGRISGRTWGKHVADPQAPSGAKPQK